MAPDFVPGLRLARDLMRLCLLMHRRYPPYSKWLGTAVARLPDTAGLTASLTAAISAGGWPAREPRLREAYETVVALHNELGLTPRSTRAPAISGSCGLASRRPEVPHFCYPDIWEERRSP